MMYKTIGVLAHVDAGKTTFSEQLLYHTNAIRARGRVDHQDSFLDTHQIEKERGITVFSDQTFFTYGDSKYTLIDTPGHVDFSPEMERSIQVMDYAVVIISAVEGVEGHTETVFQLLKKYRIPTFFFINKTDREGADSHKVIQEIYNHLTKNVVRWDDELDEETIEAVAEKDEQLLEHYFTEGYDESLWQAKSRELIQQRQLFLVMEGAALHDEGVQSFVRVLDDMTKTTYESTGSLHAKVYKIRHNEAGQKLTFLKIMQGKVQVRDEVAYKGAVEKITGMYQYFGAKQQAITEAEAGMLVAVTGMSVAQVGDTIGYEGLTDFELIPTLMSTVQCDGTVHMKDLFRHFQQLHVEDPSLQVEWNDHFQAIHVHVMGKIQLDVLQQVMEDRFSIKITFDQPKILYQETIASSVIGYGHFEPLKHYAEVHVKLSPTPRGSGVTFESVSHPNDLSLGYQNAVKQAILERPHHGLLTGSAVTDMHVTLLTGRADQEHTAGGDFREATLRALRQGLEQVENFVLEPFYTFKVKVNQSLVGRVLSDVQQAHGQFDAPETIGDDTLITGCVPVATFMDYPTVFASLTNGRGMLQLQFGGYQRCHNEAEVIERMQYDKDADPLYSSNSIFCTKGKGYTVSWEEAKAAMHCDVNHQL